MNNTDTVSGSKLHRSDARLPELVLIFFVMQLLTISLVYGQPLLTLDSCIIQANRHYQFHTQHSVSTSITDRNVSRLERGYLPTLDLLALSSYQNTQIEIPAGVDIPGYMPPKVPLYANNALLELRQWIYDGSVVYHSVLVEKAQGNVAQLEIEKQKLDLKTLVMQRFFSILLIDKQLSNLRLRDTVLNVRLKELEVGVRNNIVLAAEMDLLSAEIIKVNVAVINTEYSRRQQLHTLAEMMGVELGDDTKLEVPTAQIAQSATTTNRPDIRLIDEQIQLLEMRKGVISSTYLPKIGLYGDIGVGYPGYNIFDPNPALMAKVGLNLTWRIFDWNQGALQEQSIDLNKELLGVQRDRLNTQVRSQAKTFLDDLSRSEALMKLDKQLLDLYTSVTDVYASKLRNGTITSAQYVEQLIKQEEVRVDADLHELQRVIAIINYNTTLGY